MKMTVGPHHRDPYAVQTFILNTAQSLTSTVLTALDTGANYRQAARQVANGVASGGSTQDVVLLPMRPVVLEMLGSFIDLMNPEVTAALQECDTFVDTLYGFSRTAAGC